MWRTSCIASGAIARRDEAMIRGSGWPGGSQERSRELGFVDVDDVDGLLTVANQCRLPGGAARVRLAPIDNRGAVLAVTIGDRLRIKRPSPPNSLGNPGDAAAPDAALPGINLEGESGASESGS